MTTAKQVLAFARDQRRESPGVSEEELRHALQKRFLGDVNYLSTAAAAGSASPNDPLGGCLLGMLCSPFFALWDRLFEPPPERISAWIEEAIEVSRGEGRDTIS